jgi:methane/ammonia monooxygenase subunit C
VSLVTGTTRTPEAAAVAEVPLFDGRLSVTGTLAICTFYVGVLIYEHVFSWYAGVDSFSPDFTTYWMTVLYIAEPVELLSFLVLIGWMWKTRDKDVTNVQPREEMRRIFTLLEWILIYGVAIYWGLSFFTEQSATWHVATVADSDFTPTDIIQFYMSYPTYIIVGRVASCMPAQGFRPSPARAGRLPTFSCSLARL